MKRAPSVPFLLALAAGLLQAADERDALYLRFRPLSADGVYASLQTNIHRVPWYVSYPDIPRAGRNYARVRVHQDTYSPWAKLAPEWGTIELSFFADEPLPKVEVEIQLADQPDENAVFHTMQVREVGHLVGLALPKDYRDNPDGIETIRQASERHLQMAASLNLTQEHLPKLFGFVTGANHGHYDDWQIWKNEMQVLRILGINTTSYPDSEEALEICRDLGFSRFITTNLMAEPNIIKRQKELSENAFQRIQAVALADEPGNAGLTLMDQRPLNEFHSFLQDQGLRPSDFNADAWDDVKPVKNASDVEKTAYNWGARRGERARKAFYWTQRYAQRLNARAFKEATARVEADYAPGTLTYVNFTDHPIIISGRMLPGIDWFEIGLERATTLMWTEDWLYGSSTSWGNGLYQRLGFLCDILRAAGSRHGQPLGFYNTMDAGENLRMKAFIVIGHGVKSIDLFHYGPTCAATENYWSDSESQYRGVAKLTRDVGKAEELLYPGEPVPAQVALVYSTTAEIWGQPPERGHEKQLIHIALAQEQYPCDVANEDLLLSRDLSLYKVIYLVDTHLPAACLSKLRNYVENGGTLCLAPGAGEKDEYDRPAGILQEPSSGEGSLAAGDELPLVAQNVGKGRIIRYKVAPGLRFFGAIQAANPEGYVAEFPAEPRRLITLPCEVAGVERPVELSVLGLEANLLVSDGGAALVLVNLTRKPIEKLDVRVRMTGVREVSSVEHGNLPATQEQGVVTFSLPLELTDIVLLRK